MPTLIHHLALVSQSEQLQSSVVMTISAALQKQLTRDFAPIWEISATVDVFDTLEDVPLGYWPLVVMDDIHTPNAYGVHEDKNGQPIALIAFDQNIDRISVTASHEALEMLVDPSGNRLVAGDSPKEDQGRVSFLVEVCDPSQAADYAYSVNGILVSDFYTPYYLDPFKSTARYSFTGAIVEPRQVLPDGYLSWIDPESGRWWQQTVSKSDITFRELGPIDHSTSGNLRASIDRAASSLTAAALARGRGKAAAAGLDARRVSQATQARGRRLGEDIARIVARAAANSEDDIRPP